MNHTYVIGLDYGTNSLRAVLYQTDSGKEVTSAIYPYPTGLDGIHYLKNESQSARQNPLDYINGLIFCLKSIAHDANDHVKKNIIAIGVGATGSTPLPVTENLLPLSTKVEFSNNLNAFAWLWKDHTSVREAEWFSRKSKAYHTDYVSICGGEYSSEWFWAKILHCIKVDPAVMYACSTWLELADFIPNYLTGNQDIKKLVRNTCAAGHKALYDSKWFGLPEHPFFEDYGSLLNNKIHQNYSNLQVSGQPIGTLYPEIARQTGLSSTIIISTGILDAHAGAIGAGCREEVMVKIMGTSTCDCLVSPLSKDNNQINGISGVAENSILPGYYGIEAGQSAVGDIFKWFAEECAKEETYQSLEEKCSQLRPGETGLLALDWHNGCRNVFPDHHVSGLIIGQTLKTRNDHIYRTLIEATGFGAKLILNTLENQNVKVNEIICCGGLALKNNCLMQIYADILERPIHVAKSEQTCALGAAITAIVAANPQHFTFEQAQQQMIPAPEKTFYPQEKASDTYQTLFDLYQQLAENFSGKAFHSMQSIMKKLLEIKENMI